MTGRVVLLNDTSTRYHHGCTRVMRLLTEGLERHGLTITARAAARADWDRDADFLTALSEADLAIINGEGTLHSGKPSAERLLRLAGHPAAQSTKLALVNAMYADNPAAWNSALSGFDLIAARDSASAATLSAATGGPVRWLFDLSLTSGDPEVGDAPRHGTIIGDSVRFNRRQALARALPRFAPARFVPTKTLAHPVWRWPLLRGGLYRAYNGVWPLVTPPFEMPQTEAAYLDTLRGAALHVTGRFHAVCLSLITRTPFAAVTSNTGKIEQLLRDAGLSTDRVVSEDALRTLPTDPAAHGFTDEEQAAIAALLDRAQRDAEVLFADLAALARGTP